MSWINDKLLSEVYSNYKKEAKCYCTELMNMDLHIYEKPDGVFLRVYYNCNGCNRRITGVTRLSWYD